MVNKFQNSKEDSANSTICLQLDVRRRFALDTCTNVDKVERLKDIV